MPTITAPADRNRRSIYVLAQRNMRLPLALLWALPLLASLAMLVPTALDAGAWRMALAQPQLSSALSLSLATGAGATLLALALSLVLLAGLVARRPSSFCICL